jgi:hypothetical protein
VPLFFAIFLLAVLTPKQRSQRASIAALSRWAREDPAANAARGQAGLRARFLREVDEESPDLPEAERQRRATTLYRLHFKRLRYLRSRRDQAVGAA